MSGAGADDAAWMARALAEAAAAGRAGEVPVGAAVAAADGTLLAAAGNRSIRDRDPSAHAEVAALREAGRRAGNYRLPGAVLYVTLEPCLMCVGAALLARVARVVYGAPDPKAGCLGGAFDVRSLAFPNHRFAVAGGVLAADCGRLLTDFFRARRERGQGI